MLLPRPEDERMCETSEKDERLFSDDDILPINLEIGKRIMEIFGNQAISNITFRLRSTAREVNDILDGRALPSCELLLGIQKLTGVSIDWLLTGEGEKFKRQIEIVEKRDGEFTTGPIYSPPSLNTDGPVLRRV